MVAQLRTGSDPEIFLRQEIKALDRQFEEHVITEVSRGRKGYTITMGNSGFGLSDEYNKKKIVPKARDAIRIYGGFGYPIRGVDINGQEVYYRTQNEQDALHHKWVADEKAKRLREYKKTGKRKQDAIYNKLPKVFKQRIDRFRAGNPEFRIEYEGYELFCCTEALKIARALKTKEEVLLFGQLNYDDQRKRVKFSDGHSGNTFGMAVRLAHWYISNKDNVVKEHGALTPLVGCKDYGCPH